MTIYSLKVENEIKKSILARIIRRKSRKKIVAALPDMELFTVIWEEKNLREIFGCRHAAEKHLDFLERAGIKCRISESLGKKTMHPIGGFFCDNCWGIGNKIANIEKIESCGWCHLQTPCSGTLCYNCQKLKNDFKTNEHTKGSITWYNSAKKSNVGEIIYLNSTLYIKLPHEANGELRTSPYSL